MEVVLYFKIDDDPRDIFYGMPYYIPPKLNASIYFSAN